MTTEISVASALDASEAAAAEAGDSPTDTAVMGCGMLRIGVFFDGTGNSRDHADLVGSPGIDVESWHTNVDLLERIYKKSDSTEDITVAGQQRKIRYFSHYLRGIGVAIDGSTTTFGMSMGRGEEGVAARVEQAMNELRLLIDTNVGDVQPCDIWFDTFGFSRGSAAARDFSNSILDAELTYGSARCEVKFLGIYDTVSSVGNAYPWNRANPGSWHEMNIRSQREDAINPSTTRPIAEKIVHITAKDEVRYDFPLALAHRETRIQVVGAHSDIGGGYHPGGDTSTFTYEWSDFPGVLDFYLDRWIGVGGENAFETEAVAWNALGERRIGTVTLTTRVQHGLQFVTLRLMHDNAVSAGVPFKPLPAVIDGYDVSMNSELMDYYLALSAGNVPDEMERSIRGKYAHFSANNRSNWGFHPNLPMPNAVRVVEVH
ncbi:MAG: DUF2235 domain-containing protein [Paracoccus sp. (in: a-proteobacteria)]|nr:DUF2235 domain-containing protein [Paracoccus sp. (in: a-proteobacteria)]